MRCLLNIDLPRHLEYSGGSRHHKLAHRCRREQPRSIAQEPEVSAPSATYSDLTNIRWLNGDTGALIVAGSDTTAATITHLMYHLALDPNLATKLRTELTTTAPGDSIFLAALINETLRLHPPTPSGSLRQTPPDGLTFGKTFIPGGVTVSTPTWSLGRCKLFL